MPVTTQTTASKITLKMYVDLLDRISKGEIAFINDLKGAEKRATKELLRSGLVSNEAHLSEMERSLYAGGDELAITPEGIAALEAWSEQLKSSTLLHKAGDTLLRVLWLIIGVLVASLANFLK